MLNEKVFRAARILLPRGTWLAPGAIHVRDGRIAKVASPSELRGPTATVEWIDVGDCALVPGLVNAHAHLELTGLSGSLSPGRDFGAWVRAILVLRSKQTTIDLEQATRLGARQCLEAGATTVGDFDATGSAERALLPTADSVGPRLVLFRELLDARDAARTEGQLARVAELLPRTEHLRTALAPHAPHTVSAALLGAIAAAARSHTPAVATHWAETREEGEWLESGRGPFAALLGASPLRSGLDLLDAAGLLTQRLALVHGNCARPEEIARVARAGATLVHCPGTHAFFEREPFDLRAWHAAGVPVALGTDSLASNSALDMRLELSRLCSSHPWLDPRDAWDMATLHGARALGLAGQIGELRAGAHADLLAIRAPESDAQRCFERLAHGDFDVQQSWVGGAAARAEPRIPLPRNRPAGCASGPCNPG
ncbi:MAG TPA: amidohydrolase family protein [Planctomycetota bacterium]|nr:amidohydrolase family protein [Planctomycetota bacterium]